MIITASRLIDYMNPWLVDRLKQLEVPTLGMRNPSNTNCIYWGGKLLSCHETGAPYAIDPISLCTLGN